MGERIYRAHETGQSSEQLAHSSTLAWARQHVQQGGRLWLFLDYDGTLVPIAPTPDQARPDAALRNLLVRLAHAPALHTAILSGRPLASLQALLPATGLILAGLYGLEIQWPDSTVTLRIQSAELRPAIERVMTAWAALIGGRPGFFIEDKGAAATLHAAFASGEDAELVLPAAQEIAAQRARDNNLRLLQGHRFLDLVPTLAHKGKSVAWFLDRGDFPDAPPVYFGDDENDATAFAVVQQRKGMAIAVGSARLAYANEYLSSPAEVQEWLEILVSEAARTG